MSKVFVIGTILTAILSVSCGKNAPAGGPGILGTARCWSKEEARTFCRAEYIADGFTLEQAKLRCDPFYLYDGCYNNQLPASP